MAQEFVRINRGIKDIKNHKKIYSNEGDLFSDGEDIYTLVKNEFIRLTFYNDYLQEIEDLKEDIENSGGGVSDCNCEESLNELNLEIQKIKKDCQESIDFIDEKVLLLDEALQSLKDKQIKNEEDLSDLIDKIEDINNDIEDIKEIISELEKNNDMLNEFDLSLKEINKKIDFIKDDIETLDDFIDDIKKDLIDLNDKYLTLDGMFTNLNDKNTIIEQQIENLKVKIDKEPFYKELTYLKPLNPFIIQKDLLSDSKMIVSDKYIAFFNEHNLLLFDVKSRNLITEFELDVLTMDHIIIDDLKNSIIILGHQGSDKKSWWLYNFRIEYIKDEDGFNFKHVIKYQKYNLINGVSEILEESILSSKKSITSYNNGYYSFLFDDYIIFNLTPEKNKYSYNNSKARNSIKKLNTSNFNSYYFQSDFNIYKNENDDIVINVQKYSDSNSRINTIMNKEMLSNILDSKIDNILNVSIHKSKKLIAIIYSSNGYQKLTVLKSDIDIINDSDTIEESHYKVVFKNYEISKNSSYDSICGFINNVFFYDKESSLGGYQLNSINVNDLADGKNNWTSQDNLFQSNEKKHVNHFISNNYLIYIEEDDNNFIFNFFEPHFS